MESVRATANTMMAGPLFRAGEVTDALIEALQEDNPGTDLKVPLSWKRLVRLPQKPTTRCYGR
jgi:hypothetical protein